ncbi:secretoglobin family 1D member 2-like isoform X1 [Saccopteryx bilineata]|uniref:secretoglobin family 1D member 2-like isoform X1 n=1 Tax=Saccopteryx bilineata TaxID=59482 RepID=UPI00338E300A
MRPVLCVLLVTLAFSRYEASVLVCPAVLSQIRSLLLDPVGIYREELERYDAPPEAVQANVDIKKCLDKLSRDDRGKTLRYVINSQDACNRQV